MGKQLTVIVGAGASYDLIPGLGGTSLATANATVNPDYQPPMAADLFKYRRTFQGILENYPRARSLAATIGIRVTRGEGLEAVLRSLRDSTEENIVRQFRQIPLFLQELFGDISDYHTSEPVNYTHLMNQVLISDYEKVAFVTLNYDLFLEKSLAGVDGAKFDSLDSYVPTGRRWMLVKLHGSVNWARRVRTDPKPVNDDQVLRIVDENPVEDHLAEDIEFLPNRQERWTHEAGLLYPAIAVPVEGKYGFVCPPAHVDALERFLPSCQNYLVIGVSGRDQDLLDLLHTRVKKCSELMIVGGGDVAEVASRLTTKVQFFGGRRAVTAAGGFSRFIMNETLEEFLARLK